MQIIIETVELKDHGAAITAHCRQAGGGPFEVTLDFNCVNKAVTTLVDGEEVRHIDNIPVAVVFSNVVLALYSKSNDETEILFYPDAHHFPITVTID